MGGVRSPTLTMPGALGELPACAQKLGHEPGTNISLGIASRSCSPPWRIETRLASLVER